MSQVDSPSAQRPYGLARVCRVWKFPRSTVYHERTKRQTPPRALKKRGPKGACTDEELLAHIRTVQRNSPWVGEGYRKVWARLRFEEAVRVSPRRVLRVMRENDLLSPHKPGRAHGPKAHDRSIIPERPDELWGTDATGTLTDEGMASIFFVLDHSTAELLGIHAARRGTRFEALVPLHQAVREIFGDVETGVAAASGLKLRHDHGSQFVSHVYQNELRFLGVESSPAFVREPEGNGCAERFVRTLKEQLLWLRRFKTVEELRLELLAFKERYNNEWLIQRHGWRTPAEQRRRLTVSKVGAA